MLNDLKNYSKEIFTEGINWVFTFFDILGMILFFIPHLAQIVVTDYTVIRIIGFVIFVISFAIANFTLYRKLKNEIYTSLGPQSVVLNVEPKNNYGQISYLGKEAAQDLSVLIKYRNRSGKEITQSINEFYKLDSPNPIWHDVKILRENDSFFFHLPEKSETLNGEVLIEISFIGVISRNSVNKNQILNVTDILRQIFL